MSIEDGMKLESDCREKANEIFDDFLKKINENPFFSDTNHEMFRTIDSLTNNIMHCCKGQVFYRSRIWDGKSKFFEKGFSYYGSNDLGAPPNYMADEARVNFRRCPVLYVSSNPYISFIEVRPRFGDIVVVGEMVLLDEKRCVNLGCIPRIGNLSSIDSALSELIRKTFSKPMITPESNTYFISQIISYYIKAKGFDGIVYSSSLHEDGYNIAFFDVNACTAMSSNAFDVFDIQYKGLSYFMMNNDKKNLIIQRRTDALQSFVRPITEE
ncbi:MAG: RES family NAD+ phosphorylase [Oscillospiraceae bacterium]